MDDEEAGLPSAIVGISDPDGTANGRAFELPLELRSGESDAPNPVLLTSEPPEQSLAINHLYGYALAQSGSYVAASSFDGREVQAWVEVSSLDSEGNWLSLEYYHGDSEDEFGAAIPKRTANASGDIASERSCLFA